MDYFGDCFLRFAYAPLLYVLIPIVFIVCLLRMKSVKNTIYKYSLGAWIKKSNFASRNQYKKIFYLMRFLSLIVLALLIGKPQLVDPRSKIKIEGIDIMIVLDASGSMQHKYSEDGKQSRFDIAKQEALRFIEKRDNDPIGLVIFGREVVSRCPLTLDKNILQEIVKSLQLGVVDPRGTFLSLAALTAANRLKDSEAKSRIMILLTDGAPTRGDVDPELAIDIAKKVGTKIYTVGIGSEVEYIDHPFYGRVLNPDVINKKLLQKIAKQTGGKFFMAKNPQDMRDIYTTIDQLEKTEYETNIYSKHFDIFMPFVWIILVILLLELVLSTFLWFEI